MPYKEILSTIAIIITLVAFVPFIRSILKDETKPHVFSWVIWGSTTFIIALAQFSDNAGVGALPIALSGVISIYVAILSYVKMNDHTITKFDWSVFFVAMSAIPLWYVTSNPLWAVLVLTTIDSLGFIPTLRKAYYYPEEENLTFYVLMTIRNFVVIMALEYYSLTTILFPLVMNIMGIWLIGLIVYRRRYKK